jgi:hypothetical protein
MKELGCVESYEASRKKELQVFIFSFGLFHVILSLSLPYIPWGY